MVWTPVDPLQMIVWYSTRQDNVHDINTGYRIVAVV